MKKKEGTFKRLLALNDFSDINSDQLIPIIPEEDFDLSEGLEGELDLPILPIRNTVLFPGVVLPITVGRQKSVKLVRQANEGNKILGVVAQRNIDIDEPAPDDVYKIGTIARILKLLILPDGNTTIIIQGVHKFEIEEFVQTNPFLLARVQTVEDRFPKQQNKELKALVQSLRDSAYKMLKLNPDIPQEAQFAIDNISNPSSLTYYLSSNLNSKVKEKQSLLEMNDGRKRAKRLLEYMLREIQMLELKHEIQSKAHSDIDQQQRDYFLRQQMKVLQDELGMDGPDQEMEALRAKADKKKWRKEVKEHFHKELNKVSRMNPASAEYPLLMNYCEVLVDLPWNDFTEDKFDLEKAQKVLDADHYGLEKVKDRIIEYLAVLKLRQDMKAPILCLYGPPGVGKTSLGRSVAKALGRQYIRMSLGGIRDEAEIRGHRKTYVGAMPGKIIQNIRKAKTSNPVFILDEVDKVGADFRGDPSSALLEVLDPEQNFSFMDNYLEVEYDLSRVMFIATANSLDTIQPALRDRMEIIEVNGYTIEEKIQIAKKHLIPKIRKEHGLKAKDVSFDNSGIQAIIERYTRESGVRGLERKLGSVVRNIARSVATESEYTKRIKAAQAEEILGKPIFDNEIYEDNQVPGVVCGLAWTPSGGEILFIEASKSKGKGKLILSGKLGEVMKESASAALSYLKAHAEDLKIPVEDFEQNDLHVHVPAGAVPKDGPSAGITILSALASLYTNKRVKPHFAMTGEITLTGRVLPVGGIKEKVLAAKRANIKQLVISEKNRKDVDEIGEQYIKGIKFHYVKHASEVLKMVF